MGSEDRWNVYFAILAYPASLTPEEYADLAARHLKWCLENGIQQVLHACYTMEATRGEVETLVKSVVCGETSRPEEAKRKFMTLRRVFILYKEGNILRQRSFISLRVGAILLHKEKK